MLYTYGISMRARVWTLTIHLKGWAWQHEPVISMLGRLGQENTKGREGDIC